MTAENEGISSSSSLSYMSHQLKYLHYIWTERACSLVNFKPACSLANQRVQLSILNQCVLSSIDTFLKTSDQRIEQITTHLLIAQRIVLERQCYVIKTTRQYCLIAAFNTFIIWLITITSQQLNAGFFSLADIAFQGSFNVKYSVVIIIIVIIIFLHHHVRESLSCADETYSLHGAAESFYTIAIVVFILIVNFQHTILS